MSMTFDVPPDDARQDRVEALANAISQVLAGADSAEAKTALVVVAAASIVALVKDERQWEAAARYFAVNIRDILRSKEHVAYLRSSIRPTTPGRA